MRKLTEKYIRLYMVKRIVSENAVELRFPAAMRVHLVVNVRRIVKYQEQVEKQKKIPPPLVEIEGKRNMKWKRFWIEEKGGENQSI